MRSQCLHRAALMGAVAILLSACREPIAPPPPSDIAPVDSAEVLRRLKERVLPPGVFPGPVQNPPITIPYPSDSIRITLLSRECAAPTNSLELLSPENQLLSTTMCQVPVDTAWTFVGPFAADTTLVLEFITGVGGGFLDGQVDISGAFPRWFFAFEDGFDSDFNDFVIDVVAFTDSTLFNVHIEDPSLHPETGVGNTETTQLATTILLAGVPQPDVSVTYTAYFLPGSGGHKHVTTKNSFSEYPDYEGEPVVGFFTYDETPYDSIDVDTDSTGVAVLDFTAGWVGGKVEIKVSAMVDTIIMTDVDTIDIRVPDLTDLADGLSSQALFIGGIPGVHPQADTTWYVTEEFAEILEVIPAAIKDAFGGDTLNIQFNDASLPYGGAFTISTDSMTAVGGGGSKIEFPAASHVSHDLGIDIDIPLCLARSPGATASQSARIRYSATLNNCRNMSEVVQPSGYVLPKLEFRSAMAEWGDAQLHGRGDDHVHLRMR